jgi:hypothetical protein
MSIPSMEGRIFRRFSGILFATKGVNDEWRPRKRCAYFSCNGLAGHMCHADYFAPLDEYGAKVWCEDYNYLDPAFYRSEAALKEIRIPSKKTLEAYYKWRNT